jgi:DNA replication protein DnaC
MKDTDQLEALLRSLNLKSFIRNYKDFGEKSHKQKLSHIEYLRELVQAESTERQIRKVERLIKEAKLPREPAHIRHSRIWENTFIIGLGQGVVPKGTARVLHNCCGVGARVAGG